MAVSLLCGLRDRDRLCRRRRVEERHLRPALRL